MAEQQHEPLQQRDLEQHEAGAQRAEVGEPRAPARPRPISADEQRSDHEHDDQRRGDRHQRHQRAETVAEQHAAAERDLHLIAQPRRVEEERPIVRC